jgi:hypothetical protein
LLLGLANARCAMNGDPGSSAYMRSVMPSQVVQTIDELFPHVARGQGGDGWVQAQHSSKLIGIISLAKAIPHELFAVSASDYASFVLAVSTIEFHIAVWTARGPVGGMDLVDGTDVVTVLRRILIKCLDEYPPPSTTELLFIADGELRDSIRRDLGAAHRAFQNSEWKAATVLAGAAIEALLLWKLQEPPRTNAEVFDAAKKLAAASTPKRGEPHKDINFWGLEHYIAVAEHFTVIKGDTPTAARLAQNFRNLIHPGRAIRRQQTCDRATAHSALGALDHVIRDLS